MANIILVHGFNVLDGGKETIDSIVPYLSRQHTVQQADYGWAGLLTVRLFNKNFARLIAGMSIPGSVAIGHSNGCALLFKAVSLTKNIEHLILINPALDNDVAFPACLKKITVLFNSDDEVVTTAKWFINHPWGDMGRVGSTVGDPRVACFDTKLMYNVSGHSAVFKDKSVIKRLVGFIEADIDV